MLGEDVISTGIEEVDELLGGGILRNGILLIDYDKLSMGWHLGVRIFKNILQQDGYGIVFNATVPVTKLRLRAKYLWLDVDRMGREGRLSIVDIFGSKYGIPSREEYIYTIDDWKDEVALPKMGRILKELTYKIKPMKGPVVSMFATVEGAYHTLGKGLTHHIMLGTLKASSIAEELDLNSFQILLLNRNAVDPMFETFLTTISDQVIMVDRKREGNKWVESISVPKSLLPGFIPRMKEHVMKIER